MDGDRSLAVRWTHPLRPVQQGFLSNAWQPNAILGLQLLAFTRSQLFRQRRTAQVYSHPDRYVDFFDGETEGRRKGMLYKWTREMREKGTWADQLFINAIARAHEVCAGLEY